MTAYHVLLVGASGGCSVVATHIEASNAEGAIRGYAATKAETEKDPSGSYVAVPSRSWKPVTVEVETQTRIRIGGQA